MKTYAFSEWTVAFSDGAIGFATVFLTDDGQAYLMLTTEQVSKFYHVNAELIGKDIEHFFKS